MFSGSRTTRTAGHSRASQADVSSVLYKMDFDWSAKNKDRILTEWKQKIER